MQPMSDRDMTAPTQVGFQVQDREGAFQVERGARCSGLGVRYSLASSEDGSYRLSTVQSSLRKGG